MKKIFTLLTILIASTTLIFAQDSKFSVGVKGGMNLSKMKLEDVDTQTNNGFRFGVVGEYKLSNNFFIQSGLDILSKGSKNDVDLAPYSTAYKVSGIGKMKWNQTYLQLPALIGYQINATQDFRIRLTAGPYFAMGVGGKVKFEGVMLAEDAIGDVTAYRLKDKENTFSGNALQRFDMGMQGAVGLEYQRIQLSIGYEYGLTNISQFDNSIHNMTGFATLGYRIF